MYIHLTLAAIHSKNSYIAYSGVVYIPVQVRTVPPYKTIKLDYVAGCVHGICYTKSYGLKLLNSGHRF